MRATKASSFYTVIAKLVVTTDRRKASKYAAVLQLAACQGIDPTAEAIVTFIQAEGGVEACLRQLRETPRESGVPTRKGRPSAFSQAIERLATVARSKAPEDLQTHASPHDYVLIVGVRGDDGTLQLRTNPSPMTGWCAKRLPRWRPNGQGRGRWHNGML